MGVTIVRNGIVTDRPLDEVNIESPIDHGDLGPAQDGRTYLPYASKSYLQDGSTEIVTGRQFNAAISLPPSGNISKVLGPTTKPAS